MNLYISYSVIPFLSLSPSGSSSSSRSLRTSLTTPTSFVVKGASPSPSNASSSASLASSTSLASPVSPASRASPAAARRSISPRATSTPPPPLTTTTPDARRDKTTAKEQHIGTPHSRPQQLPLGVSLTASGHHTDHKHPTTTALPPTNDAEGVPWLKSQGFPAPIDESTKRRSYDHRVTPTPPEGSYDHRVTPTSPETPLSPSSPNSPGGQRQPRLSGGISESNDDDDKRSGVKSGSLVSSPRSPHYGTKLGHFETSKIHFPTSEGVSERANGRASGPVLTSLFLFVPDHSALSGQPGIRIFRLSVDSHSFLVISRCF